MTRIRDYKNNGRMPKLRMRRIDNMKKLRKARKEEQLGRRRNLVDDEEPFSSLMDWFSQASSTFTIEDIVCEIVNCEKLTELRATYALCRMLNAKQGEDSSIMLIDKLIKAKGVVPQLVEYLHIHTKPYLQYTAAWALTMIATGTSEQIKAVIDAGAVSDFITLLDSPHQELAVEAVRALGYIAAGGSEFRDFVISAGAIEPLLSLIKPDADAIFFPIVSLVLGQFCHWKNPPLSLAVVKEFLPAFSHLLTRFERSILVNVSIALSDLTDTTEEVMQEVVEAEFVPRLVSMLDNPEIPVIIQSLRAIKNIFIVSDDCQKEDVVDSGVCVKLAEFLQHSNEFVVKVAAETVSTIAGANNYHIGVLIDSNVLRPLVNALVHPDLRCQIKAARAVVNITKGGCKQQISDLCQFGAVQNLCQVLEQNKLVCQCGGQSIVCYWYDPKRAAFIAEVLDGIYNVLAATDSAMAIKDCGGLVRIESLRGTVDRAIFDKATAILQDYFLDDWKGVHEERMRIKKERFDKGLYGH